MKICKLWEIPILSQELEDDFQIIINGSDITISIQYFDSFYQDIKLRTSIKFHTVLCHKYTSEILTLELYDSYDTLVQVEDSDWLKEIYQIQSMDSTGIRLNHYAIYFASRGLYQFIAKDYEIKEEEVRKECLLASCQ